MQPVWFDYWGVKTMRIFVFCTLLYTYHLGTISLISFLNITLFPNRPVRIMSCSFSITCMSELYYLHRWTYHTLDGLQLNLKCPGTRTDKIHPPEAAESQDGPPCMGQHHPCIKEHKYPEQTYASGLAPLINTNSIPSCAHHPMTEPNTAQPHPRPRRNFENPGNTFLLMSSISIPS